MPIFTTLGAACAKAWGFTSGLVKDQYFNLVSLLLPGNGTNGAQNNTFLDSSTNNFTITRNGNTTQGTFSPFSQTGWGNYFDGSGDSLTVPSGSSVSGTGNFTVEFFIYPSTIASGYKVVYINETSGGFAVLLNSTGTLSYGRALVAVDGTTTGTVTFNQWNHVAFVRSGTGANQFVCYINGSSAGSFTNSTSYASGIVRIGTDSGGVSFPFDGYLSNVRSATVAVYTGAFTVPTSPLTATQSAGTNISAITGTQTSLLTCQSNRFIDNSTNNFTITRNGDTRVVAFSPFNPTSSWSATTNGGSGYFDGSGDYVAAASVGTAANLGTTWTVECWLYPTSVASTAGIVSINTGTTNQGINIYRNGTTITVDNGSSAGTGPSGGTLIANAWQHLAIVADGTNTKIWLNGSQAGSTYTGTVTSGTPTQIWIGSAVTGLGLWSGYVANTRIVKGTAVYTGAFTPPIAPLSTSGAASASAYSSTTNVNTSFASSETSLLLNFTNAGIYDATSKNDLETVGNAQISTSQSKFGGSSMAFDGTGDYLVGPANNFYNFGTGDFTIECWLRLNATSSAMMIASTNYNSGTGAGGWAFIYRGDISSLSLSVNSNVTYTKSWSPSTNNWYHVAASRSGSSLRLFVAGTQIGATSTSTDNVSGSSTIVVAGNLGGGTNLVLNGYLQDLRITNYARYTTNFTPPTSLFPLQ